MRLATWNIERLEHQTKLDTIIAACEEMDADILVLTEADVRVQLPRYDNNPFETEPPKDHELPPFTMQVHYKETERRVIIYSKNLPLIKSHRTFDTSIAICVELQTEYGPLCVYGTIIGIHGSRKPFFEDELRGMMSDIKRLVASGKQVCVLGDYNCSFTDKYFNSDVTRDTILNFFSETNIDLLTEKQAQCVDHIAVSHSFIKERAFHVEMWDLDKRLSDHKRIAVEF